MFEPRLKTAANQYPEMTAVRGAGQASSDDQRAMNLGGTRHGPIWHPWMDVRVLAQNPKVARSNRARDLIRQQLLDDQLDRRTHITRELSLIEARETRLVEAIKRGDAVEPLVAALKDEWRSTIDSATHDYAGCS